MQIQPPHRFEEGSIAGLESKHLPPAGIDASDHLGAIREEALLLLRPDRKRELVLLVAAGALVTGFGLGWAGGSSWSSLRTVAALEPPAQKDAILRQPEIKSAGKADNVRKPSPLAGGANNPPKSQGISTATVRVGGESSKAPILALPADTGLAGTPMAAHEPLIAAPETRPTTIEGWTVREVRGATAVLEGPNGVRMATAGDTVPGIGRIDSIVRWGNRWIVATASGLIATP